MWWIVLSILVAVFITEGIIILLLFLYLKNNKEAYKRFWNIK